MRTTIYLEDELNERLRRLVPRRGLNRFINNALTEKIDAIERRQVEEAMKEGYLATAQDRAALNQDWDVVDVESWPT